MAHASEIADCLKFYQEELAKEKRWKRYTEYLYKRDKKTNRLENALFGRFCFNQQLRFFVVLTPDTSSGYIDARFWRENPQEIGETLCGSSFALKLLAALDMFPEMKETEFHKDRETGWLIEDEEK